MTDDIKAIRDALQAGPVASEWIADIPGEEHFWAREAFVRAQSWGVVARIGLDATLPHWDKPQRAAAAYIAACHPERIARLLDALEQAQKDAAQYFESVHPTRLKKFADNIRRIQRNTR